MTIRRAPIPSANVAARDSAGYRVLLFSPRPYTAISRIKCIRVPRWVVMSAPDRFRKIRWPVGKGAGGAHLRGSSGRITALAQYRPPLISEKWAHLKARFRAAAIHVFPAPLGPCPVLGSDGAPSPGQNLFFRINRGCGAFLGQWWVSIAGWSQVPPDLIAALALFRALRRVDSGPKSMFLYRGAALPTFAFSPEDPYAANAASRSTFPIPPILLTVSIVSYLGTSGTFCNCGDSTASSLFVCFYLLRDPP